MIFSKMDALLLELLLRVVEKMTFLDIELKPLRVKIVL